MTRNKYIQSKLENVLLIFATLGIIISLLCNQWVISWLFSPDGVLETTTKVKLLLFEIFLLGVSSLLLAGRHLLAQSAYRHPNILAGLVGIWLLAALWTSAEIICCWLINARSMAIIEYGDTDIKLWLDDCDLGHRLMPSSIIHHARRRRLDGKLLFDSIYTIDEYARRLTPYTGKETADKFLLFFVDSFVFGWGVNDDQTLPYYVGQCAPGYRPYNYGVSAYGPQQLLVILANDKIQKEVPFKSGILVYLFLDTHIQRAAVFMRQYDGQVRRYPYYELSQDNTLISYPSLKDARPVRAFLYDLAVKSQFLKYFNINIPLVVSKKHIALTSKIIEESYKGFKFRFPESKFYVLFYPGCRYSAKVIPYLQHAGIEYLDYSALWDKQQRQRYTIGGDRHPSKEAYKYIACKLTADLGIKQGKGCE